MASILKDLKQRFTSSTKTAKETLDGSAFLSGAGGTSILDDFFGTDVFNEEEMNPHSEMNRVREMIDNNAFITSALSKYQAIFIGDELTVEAQDARTEQVMNDWLEDSGLVEAFSNGGVGEHFKGIGNAYYHVKNGQATGMVREFELIANPQNMWIRLNDDGSVRDYILEVDRSEQPDEDSEDRSAESYIVGYGGFEKKPVYGIRYDKDEIIHVPQGMHKIPPYGRSDLASASSDEKILREIERSYGVIARHKQVPKKIISLYQEQGGDRVPLPSEEFDDKLNHLNNLRDTDNPVWNNIEADIEDYSYSGEDVSMKETIDYLKRKLTGAILPQSLMHPDMTTQATAEGELKALFLQMRGERQEHEKRFNPILRQVAEEKDLNTDGLKLSFGQLDLRTEQGRKKDALEMWQKGVVSLDEVRDMVGLPEQEAFDEDPFKWEVQSQPSPDAVQQNLRDAIKGEEN